MKLNDESDLLKKVFRAYIIGQINGTENVSRKEGLKKRYEVYKDNTSRYVIDNLKAELGDDVVKEIIHRTSNISICRKIITKKAMVYRDGAKRETDTENQDSIDVITRYAEVNTLMKKVNTYVELFKNTDVFVSPYEDKSTGLYKIKAQALRPYDYDVIEDSECPEEPRVYIFSYYVSDNNEIYAEPNKAGVHGKTSGVSFRSGDGKNQAIADSPADEGVKKEYVWWSNNYHFTTDEKGELVSEKTPEDLVNPIGCLPFINFSKDKDGHFWAVGGEDLVDGSILVNTLLTDLYYISKLQGMGIFYLFGKGVPKSVKIGPSDAIILDTDEDGPTPQIGFASSNPPIQSHMAMIEQYLALLLSTNNLETSAIKGTLGVDTAASGVHELIKRAENTDDVEEQREQYRNKEPKLYKLLIKWINLYNDEKLLDGNVSELPQIDEDIPINLTFAKPKQFQTETEELDIIQKRRDMGLDSMIDSLMRDDHSLSQEEAEEKLLRILEEKLKEKVLSSQFIQPIKEENPNKEEEKEDEEKDEKEVVEKDDEQGKQEGKEKEVKEKKDKEEDNKEEDNKEEEIDVTKTLNGAQVRSIIDVVTQFKDGILSEGSALELLRVAFNLDEEVALKVLKG